MLIINIMVLRSFKLSNKNIITLLIYFQVFWKRFKTNVELCYILCSACLKSVLTTTF